MPAMAIDRKTVATTNRIKRANSHGGPSLAFALLLAFAAVPASGQSLHGEPRFATDPENCLSCHRFRGLSRLDTATGEVRLFSCSIEYYAYQQGPHSRLRCTDCHQRDEVAVIPHQVKTPVDCTRACHIQSGTGIAAEFSHASIAKRLEHSAHNAETLSALKLSEPLLRPGQSTCLYCHDEPMFRDPIADLVHVRGGEPEARCDTCHRQTLPLDTSYFRQHVLSRLQPARTVRPLAQTCAVCHSDPAVIAQFGSHDTVASYLHSFHGKAGLLGSTETATCVDCHRSQMGDVHLMVGADHAESSINPARLVTTCRTTDCHPGAPPAMTSAAVHLDLNPQVRSPEYYLAAVFILLTAGVMVVYFLLIILELFAVVIGRHDPDHHQLCTAARKLQAIPDARQQLMRMNPHERIQHWGLVIFFTLLVITGMPMKFADSDWAGSLIADFGNLTIARWVHRASGVLLLVAFAYHIIYLLVNLARRIKEARRRDPATTAWQVILSGSMVITPTDVRQFFQLFAFLLFLRRTRPQFGHFNFMQKFEYWAVFWGTPVLGISGLVLWRASWVTEYLSGRVLNFSFIIHTLEAYLAFIHVAVVHLISVVFGPAVFPMSMGTFSGQAPAAELAEGHRGEVERLAREYGIAVEAVPHKRHGIRHAAGEILKRLYSMGLLTATALVGFVAMRFLLLLLFTQQQAPVDIKDIPKRLDVETIMAQAAADGSEKDPEEASMIRGPLAHYHQIPPWQNASLGSNCTTSGCHAPLPHGNRIEVRAFLNMHATFADCMVCHGAPELKELQLRWKSPGSHDPRETPVVLRIAQLVEGNIPADLVQRRNLHDKLCGLLRQATRETPSKDFHRWLLRLDTTVPDNDLWVRAVQDIQSGISLHVHGEYDSLLYLFAGNQLVTGDGQQVLDATRSYLEGGSTLTEQRRAELLKTVHQSVRSDGLTCLTCHAPDATFVNFAALGYPESRAKALMHNATINQILAIEAGQTFYLPTFIGTDDRK